MRLIDRDKLEAFGATCKSQDYMDGVKDTLEYIDNLPTVDAIPIEWIQNWGNKEGFGFPNWLREMIADWKKEQEKQNGD